MLQDFTVAVLRNKPPDLYKFAAEHFNKLYAEKSGGRAGTPDSQKDPRKSKEGRTGSPSSRATSDASSREPSPGNISHYLTRIKLFIAAVNPTTSSFT